MSDMRDDLLKTVDRIVEEHCPTSVRASAESGQWPVALWSALEDVGLTRAALPEHAGGYGLEFDDAMLALRRCGYHAMPVPLAETMLAGRLLVAAGIDVPEGALSVAPVMHDDRLRFARGEAGVVVSGTARRVPWGDGCAQIVVVGELDGQGVVGLAPHAALTGVERNLAGEPRATIEFDSTPLTAVGSLEGAQPRLEAEGALYRSVQMVGALERVLECSLLYANDRVQFGRPIGKFQAIQHLLAVLAGHVAAASAAADAAVEVSRQAPDMFAVSVAKSRVGEAAGRAAEIAHQVHGAMGYTREHYLHYSTRRLWSWRDEFGNETYWQTRLGRAVAQEGGAALWPMLSKL